MGKKKTRWSKELVQKYLNEYHEGFILVSGYAGGNEKVSIQCPKLHIRDTRWRDFIGNKNKCLSCLKEEKYNISLNTFERLIMESDYNIIEHTKNRQALVQCSERHEPYLVLFTNFNKGHRCPHCAGSMKLTLLQAKLRIEEIGYTLLSDEYESVDSSMKVKCDKGHEVPITLSGIASGSRCIVCSTHGRSGEGHYKWKGGISPLSEWLRAFLDDWKRKSLKEGSYKCDITGCTAKDGQIDVHHKYSFYKIVDSVLLELGINVKGNISLYTKEERELIVNWTQKKHMNLLGTPLLKEVHLFYHNLFGYDNTVEQYEFFKSNYEQLKSGEMTSDDFILELK